MQVAIKRRIVLWKIVSLKIEMDQFDFNFKALLLILLLSFDKNNLASWLYLIKEIRLLKIGVRPCSIKSL